MNKALKKILKPVLLPPYRWLQKDRLWVRKILSMIAPVYASKRLYKMALGKKLDLKNPKTLNEKCMWLKLNSYYNHPLITECCDKYLVRNYIKRMGCAEILNDLIGVWETPNEINFYDLPNQFALKCNHGAGYNIICTDKSRLNIENTRKQLSKWLKEDYWKVCAETQYKFIKKKIIAEKFIENKSGDLIDYKFFCESGKFKTLQVISDRYSNMQLYYFDETLVYQPSYSFSEEVKFDTSSPPKLPDNVTEMIKIAEHLSKPFPFVKVDMYNVDGKIMFSELTFIPYGAIHYTKHANMPSSIKLTNVDESVIL